MTNEEYYIAPKDEIFNEIKEKAIEIWKTYDDTYGYASGKIARIEPIKNVRDNACYIVAMFDSINQEKLLAMVAGETQEWLLDLLLWSKGSGI